MILRISIALLFVSCQVFGQANRSKELQALNDNIFSLSEVMLHDVANPPAAARFYSYAMIGAYQVALIAGQKLPDITKKFRIDPNIKVDKVPASIDLAFCINYTILQVGKQIMPSGPMLEEKQNKLISEFKKKNKRSKVPVEEQIRYCQDVAAQVIQYARKDDYNKLSTYTRYKPSKEEGHWYPTPPEYMAAVEPQWKTVRPFFLDSAKQFSPAPPVAYDKDSTSQFYKLMNEVYRIGKGLTEEQRKIANFWDCNPFAVAYSGHMAIGLKKISPGGHWMGITGIACKKANVRLDSALMIHTMVALTLHDGFISCWDEKYRSDRIRPEAAINKLMDPSWRPLLQTPPFPEYTSGHSVVSSSVSVVLTYFLGDNFRFTDTSELFFGIPERQFTSFYQAADEAAVSRLYGGIHFRDACDNGVAQGRRIGKYVLSKTFGAD